MRTGHLLFTQLLLICLGGACHGEDVSDEKVLCVLGVLVGLRPPAVPPLALLSLLSGASGTLHSLQTGYTQPGADARKDYALRRKAAREAWFPANESAIKQ